MPSTLTDHSNGPQTLTEKSAPPRLSVGPDGTSYIESRDQYLYAFDPSTGDQKWRFLTQEDSITCIPALGEDGTIYVGSQNGLFYAIYGEGEEI